MFLRLRYNKNNTYLVRCMRLYLEHCLCLNLRPSLEKNEKMRTSIVVTHSIVINIPVPPESFSEASSESSFGGSPTLISRSLFTTSGKLGLFAAFWAAQSTSRSHKAGGVSSGMVAYFQSQRCCALKNNNESAPSRQDQMRIHHASYGAGVSFVSSIHTRPCHMRIHPQIYRMDPGEPPLVPSYARRGSQHHAQLTNQICNLLPLIGTHSGDELFSFRGTVPCQPKV